MAYNNLSVPHSSSQRFKFLDGLRGVAALSVVILHNYQILSNKTHFTFPHLLDKLILQGRLGIIIFFIISGFVIAYSIRQSLISFSYYKHFFIKRSIRLDPPYWTMLALMIAASFLFSRFIAKQNEVIFSNEQLITNVLYLQTLFQFTSINPATWTLCIELQLYLFFVFILATLFRFKNIQYHAQQMQYVKSSAFASFFMFFFLLSLEQNCHLIFPSLFIHPHIGFALHYWYIFFLGVATCWERIRWISSPWLYCYYLTAFIYTWKALEIDMVTSFFFTLLIHVLGKGVYLTNWTCSSIFQYLGKISYSLYLVHWFISSNFILFVAKRIGEINFITAILILFGGIGFAILAAHFFYRWIEFPCLRWSQKVSTPKSQTLLISMH